MRPVFSGEENSKISWRRTWFYPVTENYKLTVKCGNCGTVYRAKINERKEREIRCPGCGNAVGYKFETA